MGELTKEDLERYKRQIMMDEWGEAAQKKLKNATVFIAGAGGLGSPVSINLAVAGFGHIRICDFDSADLTNLNRQILHNKTRIGMNKAASAKQTLEELNDSIVVTAITEKIIEENIEALVGDADIIMDCMDNFPIRYLLNRTAIKKDIPLVHGSVWGLEGRLTFIKYPETPCLQCIFSEAPSKETFPIVGATTSVIGALEALEAIKFITGIGENIKNKLLVWDGTYMDFKKYKVFKNPECPVCGNKER